MAKRSSSSVVFSFFAALATLTFILANPLPGILSAPIAHNFGRFENKGIAYPISKRQNVSGVLDNNGSLYTIDVTIGTPPQPISLQLDTGSSDTWTFNPAGCSLLQCVGGAFFDVIDFDIVYGDNSHVNGDYFSDNIAVGGKTVKSVQMGLAISGGGNVNIGIMGVSFDNNEAAATKYPGLLDDMVTQGIIEHHVFSLWLDDLQANSGTILFGGYQAKHFSGDLISLPIIKEKSAYIEYVVNLTSVALTTSSGTTKITVSTFNTPGLLDSGTSLIYLPTDIYQALATAFNVDNSGNLDCSIASNQGSVDFGFLTQTIKVPFSELVLNNGDGTCGFGIQSTTSLVILGDTFLRSAYVVFDLEDETIGLAQTVFV